jgi:hypothetical protein
MLETLHNLAFDLPANDHSPHNSLKRLVRDVSNRLFRFGGYLPDDIGEIVRFEKQNRDRSAKVSISD